MPVLNRITRKLIACGVVSHAQARARWYVYFDGNSYVEIPPVYLKGDFFISCKCIVENLANGEIVSGGLGTGDGIIIDFTSYNVRAFAYVKSVLTAPPISIPASLNSVLDIKLDIVGDVGTLTVNGISKSGTGWSGLDGKQDISFVGRRITNNHVGYIWDLNINNERLYKLDNNVYPSLIFKDSKSGQDGQGYNLLESSFKRSFDA